MNLQNIITYREDKEEESKSNTLENYVNNKDNYKIGRDSYNLNNNEIINENNNKNNSIHYSNSNSNINEKEIENNENNIENNIEDKNADFENIINENNNIINENIINMNNTNNTNNKIEKPEEKDIIDELLEKIRNKQDLGIPKADPKKAFEQLEQDLKLGLEQLNQIKTNSNKKTILDTQNELEKKNFEKNKKYNEVISELTKTITKPNDLNNKYRKGTYYNYKNLFILNPSFYFQEEKKNKIFEIPIKKEDRFYMSNIDGKIIINGERKNIDNNNNYYCKSERRYYSVDKKKNIGINSLQNFGIRKVNYYDKNYFMRELNRMNNFLFS